MQAIAVSKQIVVVAPEGQFSQAPDFSREWLTTKDDEVTIQSKASTKDVSLDRLNEFTKNSIGINLESAQTELIPELNNDDIPN